VYSSNRGSHLDLWSVSTSSGATRQLTRDAALDWDPVFGPEGRLLWSSDRSGHFEIWEAEADGRGARQLTRDGVDAQNPTPTSDGWVVYASGNPASRGILRVRRDGSRPSLLVPGDVFLPEVSPDGRHVAYLDLGGDGPTLRVARVADGVRTPFALPLPLSDPAADPDAGRCRWLPDGRALAFIGRAEDGAWAVYSVPFAAGARAEPLAVRRLAFERGFAAESLSISPDGGRLTVGYWDRTSNLMLAEGVRGLER
jgi:Tol biopolymer transport system component